MLAEVTLLTSQSAATLLRLDLATEKLCQCGLIGITAFTGLPQTLHAYLSLNYPRAADGWDDTTTGQASL